ARKIAGASLTRTDSTRKHESAKISRRKIIFLRVGKAIALERHFFPTQERSTAQELRNPTRRSSPSLRNRAISRAVAVHRPGIAKSHAQECSIAQESRNLMRWSVPSLRNCGISRAVTFHRSGIVKSHAQECSIARESWNLTRRKILSHTNSG